MNSNVMLSSFYSLTDYAKHFFRLFFSTYLEIFICETTYVTGAQSFVSIRSMLHTRHMLQAYA